MNIVQEIRCLLDEYGVNYDEYLRNNCFVFGIDYCDFCADYFKEIEIFGACISVLKNYFEPEQAVDEILGVRKCNLIETDRYTNSRETIHVLECSKCGKTCEHINGMPNYCPNCGARVVGE